MKTEEMRSTILWWPRESVVEVWRLTQNSLAGSGGSSRLTQRRPSINLAGRRRGKRPLPAALDAQ